MCTLSTTGCGNTETAPAAEGSPTPPPATSATGPKVVASTTWVGALARAAGAGDVAVIAPANLQHPPDYDPKPSDLAAVAGADYILYADFDGFAGKLKDAAGGHGTLVSVQLENTPKSIHTEVLRLAETFHTGPAATAWLANFDRVYAQLSAEVKRAAGKPRPAVSQAFMAYWADFAGLTVVGTYGPQPVTPSQLAELSAKKPAVVLANAHLPGTNPEIEGARRVDLINYPGSDLDLLGVFRINAARLVAALTA